MDNEIKKPEYPPETRAKLIESKREHFAAVRKECAAEFDGFRPCEKCGFLGPDCHKSCGIIMKHVSRASGF